MNVHQVIVNPHAPRKVFVSCRTKTTIQWRRHLIFWLFVYLNVLSIRTGAQDDMELWRLEGNQLASPILTLSRPTRVLCAIACSLRKCRTFTFKDGTCSLGGMDTAPENSFQKIYRILSSTGPFSYRELPRNLLTSSSTDYAASYDSAKAVDNNLGTWYCSIFNLADQWWKVDLGDVFLVSIIDLFPRNVDDAAFFRNVEIRVGSTDITDGDFTSWSLFALYAGPYSKTTGRLNFTQEQGIIGRYISVKRFYTSGALKLFDVKIFVRID